MLNISKIILGSAQLGMDYGIANKYGKPDFKSSINILNYAWSNGINTFDTSPQYGNSEKIIGSFISDKINTPEKTLYIISKLPKININSDLTFDNLYNYIKKKINQSLNNLKLKKIPIYLIHHVPDIFLKNGLIVDCLEQIKNEGLIDIFGLSIYKPEDIEISLKYKEIKAIQLPINIFDHRLIRKGYLKKLKKKGYIILARSIYLQGLFFLSTEELKEKNLEIAKEPLLRLSNIIDEYKIDIAKLAFLFVRDLPEITGLIIGAEKIEQVENNLKLLNEEPLSNKIYDRIIEDFSDLPEKLINASLWEK